MSSWPCRLTCPPLRSVARLVSAWGAGVLTSVRTEEGVVALTIDDGPDPSTTPALLDVLARRGATATFFLIGERAEAHPDLVRAVRAAGHEVGNHLWSDRPSWRLSPETFRDELRATEHVLGPEPLDLFRPGSGTFTPRMLRDAGRLGYRCVLGSPWLLATEYRGDPRRLGQRLGRRAHPGAVVVVHEGTPARSPVAEVVDALVTVLGTRGLRTATVGDLFHHARG